MPTYKVAIGTPEFKRIWLSATFVIWPLLRHSFYKIMQINSKFQDFFIPSPSKLKGFHYQIKYQLREPTICQIFSKNANGLAKKLFLQVLRCCCCLAK